jgi:hypothetical protein
MVDLPAADGSGTIPVRAFILREPSDSKLNKYWVRAHGFPYFICPYARLDDLGTDMVGDRRRYPRVIISLDPTWADPSTGRRPTLQGLGYQIERAEHAAREALGGDARGGTPRYSDGYCTNADPWYDGRGGHDYCIIDAPRAGTRLPYKKIVDLACSRFWEVPLVDVAASIVYASFTDGHGSELGFTSLADRPDGISPTLHPFYANCTEADTTDETRTGTLPSGMKLANTKLRRFPDATCRDMLILTAERDGGAGDPPSLEGLVTWCEELREIASTPGPDYVFVRFRMGANFAPPSHAERLIHELGQGDMSTLPGSGGAQDVVLFNSRAVIVRKARAHVEGTAGSELDRELMLYAAFLNETACRFSQRITEALVGENEGEIQQRASFDSAALNQATSLREDFLAFQARYYQFDTTGRPYSRRLFGRLLESLSFSDHYDEVQSELDRLHQIEQREADKRQATSDKWFEGLLFLLGLAGIVQMVIEIWTMDSAYRTSPWLWACTAGLSSVAVLAYWWVRFRRRE